MDLFSSAVPPTAPSGNRSFIASILFRARDKAAKILVHHIDDGVTSCAVGMLAYDFTVKALERAAASGKFPWLAVVTRGREIVFAVDGRSYKFFKGDHEEPASPRHAGPSLFEEFQLSHLSQMSGMREEGVHRFIVSATANGFPESVACARVTKDGELHDVEIIPLVPLSQVDVAFESTSLPLVGPATETMDTPQAKRRDAEGEQDRKDNEDGGESVARKGA